MQVLTRSAASSSGCRTTRLRASWKTQLRAPLQRIFAGQPLEPIVAECVAIHQQVLKGRVWIALHMHAGDGNVHTNIPVNSDNYEMLQTAHEAVVRIMKLARSLDGVISGEHGIGITKLEFLTDDELAPFSDYKQRVDPEGRFNKGKLLRQPGRDAGPHRLHADLTNAYTPSFGLMGHESLIMQRSDIGAISDSIKDCLRCGKCKPVCTTHVPRANLLYSPRNKILATSLLVEAFLYEEQTRRGVSIKHWEEFEDVADHCTVCHKCLSPCPVDIDFGDVSMNMRNLLRKMGQKSFRPGNSAAMLMLNATNPQTIKLVRAGMVDVGFKLQRFANKLLRVPAKAQTAAPPETHGTRAGARAGDPLHQQEAAGRAAEEDCAGAARHRGQELCPDHPRPEAHQRRQRGGVLFPGLWIRAAVLAGGSGHAGDALGGGCADRAAAGLPVLRLSAARQWPVRQGRQDHHRQPGAVPPRRQHAELPRHQDGGGQLRHLLRPAAGLPVRQDLPGLPHRRHPRVPAREGHPARWQCARQGYLFHDPCHSPMKQQEPMKTVKALVGENVVQTSRCCGESGTFGVSRPDIATQVRFRKEEQLQRDADTLRAKPGVGDMGGKVKVLTSCPSCLQGLSRYGNDLDNGLLEADYIVVEMANRILGENWMPEYVARANDGGIERVLV